MKKKAPLSECKLSIRIVLDSNGIAKFKVEADEPEMGKKQGSITYSLVRANGKIVSIKSDRLLKAFQWLQDKEHRYISSHELSNVLALDRNQINHVMNSLKTKGLVFYEHNGNKYRIVRVDDIERLQPKYDGAEE